MVVADSSKFGRKSLTLVAPLSDIDVVVSDDGLSAEWQARITAAGPELAVAVVPADEHDSRDLRSSTRRRHA